MLRSIGLTETHMECRSLKDSVPVATDLLAFEKIGERPGEVTLKHPNTDWLLTMHDAGPDAPAKMMHNHWGVRVASPAEVDAAYEYLTANKQKYKIDQIGKPTYNHGSYSVYFIEPGTNGWEIECYAEALRNEAWKTRIGGVRAPHWQNDFPAERFPGRGYVPQGFTHGTLACSDLKKSWDFYRDVLGLEVHQANPHVVYVKHPNTKPYVVCAVRPEWRNFSPNFRFTIALESAGAVEAAHRDFASSGKEAGVTELRDVTRDNGRAAFLFSDPDRNWWEIASRN
ncbi:MAG TPA: VOC family protein [Verrucomicrobiae bacterium]|jgi:catechol 2,3-dioxygenase-like lactoylglutathione lyase family enzyme|nr:VOC family protein [Verrucomicrobiae bacterium]